MKIFQNFWSKKNLLKFFFRITSLIICLLFETMLFDIVLLFTFCLSKLFFHGLFQNVIHWKMPTSVQWPMAVFITTRPVSIALRLCTTTCIALSPMVLLIMSDMHLHRTISSELRNYWIMSKYILFSGLKLRQYLQGMDISDVKNWHWKSSVAEWIVNSLQLLVVTVQLSIT